MGHDAIAGTTIISLFPPHIIGALSRYTLPAISGAVFAQFAISNPKIAVMALPIPLIMLGLLNVSQLWLVILVSVFGTIGLSRLVYKAGRL